MKVASRQIGATIDGISAALSVPRKMKFTSATSSIAMPIVIHTSSMACLVKTELSEPTTSSVSGGKLLWMSSARAVTPLEISRSLAWA